MRTTAPATSTSSQLSMRPSPWSSIVATSKPSSRSSRSTSSATAAVAAPRTPPLPTSKPSSSARSRSSRSTSSTTAAALPIPISGDVAALVAFSALPFLGVQALADSGAGKRLAEDLEKRKPALLKAAAEAERRRQRAAREEARFFGPERGRWLPRAVSDALGVWALAPHLPGEVAGDCGFDPLGLCYEENEEEEKSGKKTSRKAAKQGKKNTTSSLDAALFDRYFELELLHARWAMLGALGALVPEALSLAGLASFPEERWQFVGRARLQGTELDYLGVPGLVAAGKQCVAIIAGCQLLLMSGPELARSTGIAALEPLGIFLDGQDINYPGGKAFDPLNFARARGGGEGGGEGDASEELRLRVAEIKHGRLAMVAWLGFAAQALVGGERGRGPLRDFVELF